MLPPGLVVLKRQGPQYPLETTGQPLDDMVRPIRPTNPNRAGRFIEVVEEDFTWG